MAKNKDKKKIPFNVFRKGITAGALGLAMLFGGAGMLTGCMGEKGDRGDTGASGKSAYELAVEQGFQGTLTEWLESLKGQSGGSGSAGNDGRGIASIEKTGTNGLVDTYTITFTDGSTTTFTITNGENGTTPSAPEVTINAQGYWVINGTPTSTLATAEDGKTPYIEGEYWYIDGEPTGVKAQGAQGNDGKSAFDLYKEQNPTYTGTLAEWLESLKGQDGKGIESVTSAYEYDYTTNTEYYVFTFHYTDGTSEEKRVAIPKRISKIDYAGELVYDICQVGEEPTLKLLVTYDDLTTEEIEITDEMYIVEDNYNKPNFQIFGSYDIKVSYRGFTTTFTLNVFDPSQQQEYTITTPKYKNLQKFSHWKDEQGNVVSEDATYTYYAESEKNYEAVYVDFISMSGALLDSKTYYDADNKQYVSTNDLDGWLKMGYLTESLTKGMYVEFTVENIGSSDQLAWGISTKEYVDDYNSSPSTKGWLSNDTTGGMNKLFVAEYNVYSGHDNGREVTRWLSKIQNVSQVNQGRTTFENASIDIRDILSKNTSITIKYVLDDQLLMYVNDQLFTASNIPNWTIDDSKEYYLSFSGTKLNMSITDIGYDEYITNKGNFSTLESNPLTEDDFSGKTITFLGDSITEGVGVSAPANRYSTVLANSLGMTENNMGISGTVMCTGGHRTSRLDDIQKISYDSDYVGILLGVNDFDQCKNDGTSQYYSLGEFGSKDTKTIYGALDKMCSDLVNRFRSTDTKLFMMTPVVTSWNNSVGSSKEWDNDKLNAWGYSLRDLCDAIEEVATYYGIVTLDLNELCEMEASDFSDGIHPNNAGAQKMADTIKEFLLANYSFE